MNDAVVVRRALEWASVTVGGQAHAGESLAALDRLVARVHALERTLAAAEAVIDEGKNADDPWEAYEACRGYSRAVVLEGARQDKSFRGDETSPVVPS